jgi:cold-inducible RNA-binding protein
VHFLHLRDSKSLEFYYSHPMAACQRRDERPIKSTISFATINELSQRGNPMKNLYVGNLPHSTSEAELRNVFSAHGAVEKVTLVMDRETGRSRGFAFVEMSSASEADNAIAVLNGTDLGGRPLTVNEAKPKSDRPKSDGQRW